MMAIDPTRVSRATQHAHEEYGICAVCGQAQRLTARGSLYQHRKRDHLGFVTLDQCDGAGKPPTSASMDRR